MRQVVCEALVARAENPDMVFLTGDLGFMALEPLQVKLGERFINCGVAEQNMLTVAAALAKEKLEVWVYTIAPFCYARAFEQIRNDVCMHGLPVKMLCNGGGYGYGVMGSTHHALEDYGILSTLHGLQIFTPAALTDIPAVISLAGNLDRPCYIRLGRDERPETLSLPAFATWRHLMSGDGPIVISLGPISGPVYQALSEMRDIAAQLWIISELPVVAEHIPSDLKRAISSSGRLCIIEEHVKHGGLGSMMSQWLVEAGIGLTAFRHLYAGSRHAVLAGSQGYLRLQNGMGHTSIQDAVRAVSGREG